MPFNALRHLSERRGGEEAQCRTLMKMKMRKSMLNVNRTRHSFNKETLLLLVKSLLFLPFSSLFLNFLRKSSPIKWVLFFKSFIILKNRII